MIQEKYKNTKKMTGTILLMLFFCVLFLPVQAEAAEKSHFENPEEIRDRFLDRIYYPQYEMEYVFLRDGASIFSDPWNPEKIGYAHKYSGVIAVSSTSGYVQVIYEKKKGYGIGWMRRDWYHETSRDYMWEEKQLLADGIYEMKNTRSGKTIPVELIFQGDQQFKIRDPESKKMLGVEKKDGIYVAEPAWEQNADSETQHWQLFREYDHFYLKNKMANRYLLVREDGTFGFLKTLKKIKNRFEKPEKNWGTEDLRWTFKRDGKNVKPFRNFVQYDPDWAAVDYGNVRDHSGKIAAAGCGVLAVTNAVYALNGQFIDPLMLADFAVEKNYRIIGSGTDDGIFKGAAKEFGDAYGFHFVGRSYNIFEVKKYLKKGCVAVSHVPGHYVTIADYNEKKDKYLVLDSHPIPKRPTDPFGNWFKWNRLESGGLASSCYYIYSTDAKEDLKR